jgi:hypothetical protein
LTTPFERAAEATSGKQEIAESMVVDLLIGPYEIIGTSKSPETGATPLAEAVIHYQK